MFKDTGRPLFCAEQGRSSTSLIIGLVRARVFPACARKAGEPNLCRGHFAVLGPRAVGRVAFDKLGRDGRI